MPLLIIRQEQLRALAADVDRRRLDRFVTDFEASHPHIENCRERVLSAVKRARLYGIREKHDLQWFIALDLNRGPAWETQPGLEWALSIIDSPETDVAGRRFRLEKQLTRWDDYARTRTRTTGR